MEDKSSVAVFIDLENIHYSTLNNFSETPDWSKIVTACKQYGRISSIQAFGDWIEFSKEVPEIQKNGIQPVFVPLSQDKKSSLDCYLTVSAMKLFFQNSSIDTLILASGDRDYIPLIAELKALGKRVIILAVPGSVSMDLTTIVDQVLFYEPNQKPKSSALVATLPKGNSGLHAFVVDTLFELEKNSVNERWVNLAEIGLAIKKNNPDFSHAKYGYSRLSELLDDIAEIELKYDNHEKTRAVARTCSASDSVVKSKVYKGRIDNLCQGYGFIQPEIGSSNIFFHHSGLMDVEFFELNEGDRVTYETYNTDRGPQAEKIEKVG